MIRFIDMNRDDFGVEAICRVMRETECGFITSRAYRAAKTRPASARALRDQSLIPEIQRVHAQNYGVYGRGRCGMRCAEQAGTWAAIRSLV